MPLPISRSMSSVFQTVPYHHPLPKIATGNDITLGSNLTVGGDAFSNTQ